MENKSLTKPISEIRQDLYNILLTEGEKDDIFQEICKVLAGLNDKTLTKEFRDKIKKELDINKTKTDETIKSIRQASYPEETKVQEPNSFVRAELYLRGKYKFRFNTVSNQIEFSSRKGDAWDVLNEANIFVELKRIGFGIRQSDLKALISCSDFSEPHDPFVSYFKNLPKWDRETDHINKLANYIEAVDQSQFNYHFKKMLVRTVACATNDQIFNKHAFILVGSDHNKGKTTYCRFLCPSALEDYITESFSTDKDGQIALSENFIINMDELKGLSKADINALKSTFSRDRVKVRHPYAAKAIMTPRRASFVGSTNNEEFLIDETGSVRWLCFTVKNISWGYKKEVDINKVWAQAYQLYKDGFEYNLNASDIEENEERNRKHSKSFVELESINKFFVPGTKDENNGFFTATDFKDKIEQFSDNMKTRLNQENIGKALKILGFERVARRDNGRTHPIYGYYYKTQAITLGAETKENNIEPAQNENENEETTYYVTTDDDNDLPF